MEKPTAFCPPAKMCSRMSVLAAFPPFFLAAVPVCTMVAMWWSTDVPSQ